MVEYKSEQMMEQLVKATREAGHQLSFEEARDNPNLPDPNTYAFFWRTFSKAAEIAWHKVNRGSDEGKTTVKLSPMALALAKKKQGVD